MAVKRASITYQFSEYGYDPVSFFRCSACKKGFSFYSYELSKQYWDTPHFCPMCGARNRREESKNEKS